MECLYKKEHLGCVNYVERDPSIRIIDIKKETAFYEQPGIGKLVILLKGSVCFSYSLYKKVSMRSCRMFFLPVGHGITFFANSDSRIVLVRLDKKIHFCDSFCIEQLVSCIQRTKSPKTGLSAPYFLPVNHILRNILHQVKEISDTGYNCMVYFEKKIEELLMIMRFSYTKDRLAYFFREIIYSESHFAYKIIHNYHRFHTLSELAAFMGVNLYTFDRHFRLIFGKSAHQWINEQRKQKIYHAITSKNESFKEISDQFGFSSPAAFNSYCKLYLGDTPGKIRLKVKLLIQGEASDK